MVKQAMEELIQKFLDKELTEEERTLFKDRFEREPEFAKEVKRYVDLEVALRTAREIQPEAKEATTGRRRLMTFYWPIAAAFLLLISIPLYLLLNATSPNELAQEHFVRKRLYRLRDHSTQGDAAFQQAREAYRNKKLSKAVTFMRQAIEETPKVDEYHFTLADLYFEMNRPDSALYFYEQGRELRGDDSHALWNMAMSYLATGAFDEAEALLENIEETGTNYHKKEAKAVLKRLRSLGFRIKYRWF